MNKKSFFPIICQLILLLRLTIAQFQGVTPAEVQAFRDILSSFINVPLSGSWNIESQFYLEKTLHHDFENIDGLLKSRIGYDSHLGQFNLTLQIFDSPYIDDYLVQFTVDSLDIDASQVTSNLSCAIRGSSITVSEYEHWSVEAWPSQIYSRTSIINLQFYKMDKDDIDSHIDFPHHYGLTVTLNIEDSGAGVSFLGDIKKRHFDTWQLIFYVAFFILLCIAKIYSTWELIWMSTESYQSFKKISVVTILLIFAWDTALSRDYLMNLQIDLSDTLQGTLGTFTHLTILSETILCGIIWSQSIVQGNQSEDEESPTRYACKICATIFIVLIVCSLLSLVFQYFFSDVVRIIMSFYLIPQILVNTRELIPIELSWTFLGYNSFALMMIYLKGAPFSIGQVRPSPSFCIEYSIIIFFQFIILFVQTRYDPRFFIPESCMKTFNVSYQFKNFTDEEDVQGEEKVCAICLQNLSIDPPDMAPKREIDMLVERLNVGSKKLIITSCNHSFHVRCLLEWIETKPQCPICRTQLEKLI